MKQSNILKVVQSVAIAATLSVVAVPAYAQNNGGLLGAILGGTAGAAIGGSVDNKGSNKEGVLVGAAVGGTLGYLIGSNSDKKDRDLHNRYSNQRGEYYRHNGKAYRRYHDRDHGYVSIRVTDNDPYYYQDGRSRKAEHRRTKRSHHRYNNRY